MTFPFTCPTCRHTSQAPDQLTGRSAKCPSCGTITLVPSHNGTSGSSNLALLLILGGGLFLVVCLGIAIAAIVLVQQPPAQKAPQAEVATASHQTEDTAPEVTDLPPGSPRKADIRDDEKLPPAHWTQILREGDVLQAEKAREHLVSQGALAVPALRQLLKHENAALRLAALSILGQIGDLASEAVGDVIEVLADSEAPVRSAAAEALGRMGKPARAGLPALVRAGLDPHRGVRAAAAETLKKFGPLTAEDLQRLATLLAERETDKRLANLAALRTLELGPEAATALFAPLLKDPQPSVRVEALKAIGALGPPARARVYPALLAVLDDSDSDVRSAALVVLSTLGPVHEHDRLPLQQALRITYPEVRRFIVEALASLGPKAEPAIPALVRLLSDRDATVRATAITAFTKMGPAAWDLFDDVLALRHDNDPLVRRTVVEFVATQGREQKKVDALFSMHADDDAAVRAAVIQSLKKLQPPLGTEYLQRFHSALKSTHVDLRRFAAGETARLGSAAAPLLPTLLDAMKDPDAEVRKNIYATLAAIGPEAKLAVPTALDELSSALGEAEKDPGALARFRRAALTLDKLGEAQQIVPTLQRALASTQPGIRKEALATIAALGPAAQKLVPDLCALLRDTATRDAAVDALAQIGKPAVPDLLVILDKGPRDTKILALRALGKMKPEDAKDAMTAVYQAARIYMGTEVGSAAREVLGRINAARKNKE